MSGTTEPKRPSEAFDEDTKRILAERDASFDTDKQMAEPWAKVKADILRKLKQPQPR